MYQITYLMKGKKNERLETKSEKDQYITVLHLH